MLSTNLTKSEFGERLSQVVTPSEPVQSLEFLRGRAGELDKIEKALYAPGRHVFIYGDRGVGKSSLAATAAHQLQSSDAAYIDVGCTPDSTLRSVVASMAYQATNSSRLRTYKRTASAGIELKFLKIGVSEEVALKDLRAEIQSVGDAVEILREVAAVHSARPIVVLDEFDRIADPSERNLFADLIKQISDKKVGLQFIFTGVGSSLEELLGAHPSASRQLVSLELTRLGWEGRWEILIEAAHRFGVHVPRNIYVRIAAISDGYPYYVHLLSEHLLWAVFEDEKVTTDVSQAHLQTAIRTAIENIAAELKRPYQLATARRGSDYEEVLWSTADSEYLERYAGDMYSSYKFIMKQMDSRVVLTWKAYAARLRSLREERSGRVLMADARIPGLISYRDRMLRGFVRMQAEAHGVDLFGEQAVPRQLLHIPGSTARGYHTSQIPEGVNFSRRRDESFGPTEDDPEG